MEELKKIVVAVTGASGACYARLVVEKLVASEEVDEVALIFSDHAHAVAAHEGEVVLVDSEKVRVFDNGDLFAPPASGSSDYDGMVVVPCSMGTVGRIASGVSIDLISRAADVMIKERGRLVVVPREAPFSTLHLRNLTTLSECGVVVIPACPSFYSHPQTIDEACETIVERVMKHLGLHTDRYRWGEGGLKE